MMDIAYEKELEKLGAFEISSSMLKLAKNNERHNICLNAGRGNPNWINKQARRAFASFIEYGIQESERTMNVGEMAGYTELKGIGERFDKYVSEKNETNEFLKKSIDYCVEKLKLNKDELIKEFVDGITGNNYPVPSRCLKNMEHIISQFLQSTLYNGVDLAKETKIFPTEGGTAAMCYIFDSLEHNGLLNKGDKIAINTPIFTPYLQIPHLTGYSMAEIQLKSTEKNNWHIPNEELEKLRNPEIKAFFLVNPSNPGSHALTKENLDLIAEIAKEREDLIIITDDVYGTFVNGFQTVYSVAPHNTILVYSYSKLYGVTGWRTGLIAMHEDNIYDKLIAKLPAEKQKELDKDYSIVTLEPREFPFVERICADSRSIGLYHTSGLSTPQQCFMALMSLTHLVYEGEKDLYIEESKKIVNKRYHDLFTALGVEEDNSPSNAKYYSLIDIYKVATRNYDETFAKWIQNNFEEIDFLMRLSQEEGVVLMEGVGFASQPGMVRVSQANLVDGAYKIIGERVLKILAEYHAEYEKSKK